MRPLRTIVLAAAIILLAAGALIALTGGIDVHALRARDPVRPLAAGCVLLLAAAALDRRAAAAVLRDPGGATARLAPWIAAASAIAVTVLALRFGAFVAGGSDAYGYVSQAYAWVRGPLPGPLHVHLDLPFAASDWLQTPLGYWPGIARGTIVPSYPPGLPLMMAIGIWIAGPIGPYLVVPLSSGLFVWATYLLARGIAGRTAGAAAAVLAAASPIAAFMSLSPMSDVPSAAIWTAVAAATVAATRRSAIAAAVLVALGILVRPNLAPLAALPVVFTLAVRDGSDRWTRAAIIAAGATAAAAAIALLNTAWYGSPLLSGYGDPKALYSLHNAWPNLRHYLDWITVSQTMLILIVPLASLLLPPPARARAVLAMAVFATTLLCYLTYERYELWWYVRFLLPGFGALFAATAAGLATLASRVPRPWGSLAAATLFAVLVWHAAAFGARQQMYGPFMRSEHKYADGGEFVARQLPREAVVLAMQHSGTIRFYGGRVTLRYDLLDPDTARRLLAALADRGRHPYLAIEDAEADPVRRAFGLPDGAELPWPPIARLNRYGGFTIYDLGTPRGDTRPLPIDEGLAPRYAAPRATAY
jgi:Dolichyl-phosphate-mannose-protein mannosyltransferase